MIKRSNFNTVPRRNTGCCAALIAAHHEWCGAPHSTDVDPHSTDVIPHTADVSHPIPRTCQRREAHSADVPRYENRKKLSATLFGRRLVLIPRVIRIERIPRSVAAKRVQLAVAAPLAVGQLFRLSVVIAAERAQIRRVIAATISPRHLVVDDGCRPAAARDDTCVQIAVKHETPQRLPLRGSIERVTRHSHNLEGPAHGRAPVPRTSYRGRAHPFRGRQINVRLGILHPCMNDGENCSNTTNGQELSARRSILCGILCSLSLRYLPAFHSPLPPM